MRKNVLGGFTRIRRQVVVACVLAVAAGLVWRAADLQLRQYAFLKDEGESRHLRVVEIPAHRGMLLDRNGEPLAVSTPVASVWVNPKKFTDAHARWPELEAALAMEPGTIETMVADRGDRQFVYLRAPRSIPTPPIGSAR